ncbi:MAG TPA: hypothetical protein VHP12_09125 [Chitinophagaceae bacterium]|nr:hypothetical protein [Chitinophagaceae bacterium]
MIHRPKIISYLKLGHLLHLMTLLEIILLVVLFQTLQINTWLHEGNLFFRTIFLVPFITAPFFPQFDAYSRYQNYKLIKDHLFVHGFEQRIVKPFIKSRCQRDAVMVAAEELGMKKDCTKYFYHHGYRWYHLLPDFLFTQPQTLTCKAFWLNTFFVKYYQSKHDFKKIKLNVEKGMDEIGLLVS